MSSGIVTASYIAASVLFILALGGLSNQEKAKRAIWFGIIGMFIAVIATVFGPEVTMSFGSFLFPALIVGSVIGAFLAQRVQMTEMPELVAALHSFVGLAAVLIGINSDINPPSGLAGVEIIIHEIEIFLGVFIGAITFTGSVIAYGKLAGSIDGKALTLPGRHIINVGLLAIALILGWLYVQHAGVWTLILMTFVAFIIGAHLDSVLEGPGVNDNGSGVAGILATAEQFALEGNSPKNRLRFAFWSAEEIGLVGSYRYIESRSEAEISQILLYLNFI